VLTVIIGWLQEISFDGRRLTGYITGRSFIQVKIHTWFSSGLFPLTVLGWPDDADDLKGILSNFNFGNWP
jgi:hypothetical protein